MMTMILLLLYCVMQFTIGDKLDCCETKENGETIFKLIRVDEDQTKDYNCKDGCIYEKANEEGGKFCFRNGGDNNSECNVGEIESVLTIIENGQEVKQEVSFNNYTGLLSIDVPPHVSAMQENFTQAKVTFDVKTNANVIKTNNSCVLSDIPDYINVAGMPEYFQKLNDGTVKWDNENKTIVYDVKMVKSVVSPEDRKELTPALDSLCNNEVIKKSENERISKENYIKLMNDEIIFTDDDSKTVRKGCSKKTSKTSRGATSCGNYGWYNPVLKRHITMHQVSSGSVSLSCCAETGPQCNCTKDFPDICECKIITSKEIFMDCYLRNNNGTGDYPIVIEDSSSNRRASTIQTLTYNSKNDARSVKIHVPSHGEVGETTLLMHAANNGYWHDHATNNLLVKVGSTCYVKTLPQNIFPVEIAHGIKLINAGNVILKPEYEKNKYTIIRTDSKPLTSNEKQNLNAEIKELCKDNEILKYEEIDVDETEFQKIKDGEIVDLKIDQEQRLCTFKTLGTSNRNPRRCWRFPNEDAGIDIAVHLQTSETLQVKCCKELEIGGNQVCCKDSGFCECKDIKDWRTFQRCRTPENLEIKEGLFCQTNEYDRNKGNLIVNTKPCEDRWKWSIVWFENATIGLFESQDLQLLKIGNTCYVLPLGERDPTKIAQETAEIVKKIDGQLDPGIQKTSHSILLPRPGDIPALPDDIQYCNGANINLADEVPIEDTQFKDLNDGKVITLPENSHTPEEGKCVFQTKCASNSGNGDFLWPISTTKSPFFVHGLIATPTCISCCIEGFDQEYCECNQIDNMESFQQCIRKQEVIMVITGAEGDGDTDTNLVNRFIRNQSSPGLQLEALPESLDFPVKTAGGVGVWIDDRLIVCQGADGVKNGCYGMDFKTNSWKQGGKNEYLVDPLTRGGASAKYKSGPTGNEEGETWWIIGGDPDGKKTQEWNSVSGSNPWDPPVLPLAINTPSCMAAISDREIFVTGHPMNMVAEANHAWIFSRDYKDNGGWKELPLLGEERSGAACGFLPNNGSGWIVVAGGYKTSSTEILDLSKCVDPKSEGCAWVTGPSIGGDFYGSSMVAISTEELVLFGDHTDILAINSKFDNWDVVGKNSKPRYSAVVLVNN